LEDLSRKVFPLRSESIGEEALFEEDATKHRTPE
jgi:hypothetical protein